MTMMEEVVCVAAATPTPTACSKAGDVEETEARTEVRAAHDTGEWDGGPHSATLTECPPCETHNAQTNGRHTFAVPFLLGEDLGPSLSLACTEAAAAVLEPSTHEVHGDGRSCSSKPAAKINQGITQGGHNCPPLRI